MSKWQRYVNSFYTFPTPEQFGHLSVVGACRCLTEAPDAEIGSMFKHTPLAEHRAQAKYPAHRITSTWIIQEFGIRIRSNKKLIKFFKSGCRPWIPD